jgi:hypothetical protein
MPVAYTKKLRCFRIPNFTSQVAKIAPCTSSAILGLSPHFHIKDNVAQDLVELALRLPPNRRESASAAVGAAIANLRMAHRKSATNRKDSCGLANNSSDIVVAVHIRAGDHINTDKVKEEICFVHWVVNMLEIHIVTGDQQVQVHVYTELPNPNPDQNDHFDQFSGLLSFPRSGSAQPMQTREEAARARAQSGPPWCGASRPQALVGRLSGAQTADGSFGPLQNVVVHHDGNPLDDIMCLADADVLVSGTPSSFVDVAGALLSGLRVRPAASPEISTDSGLRARFRVLLESSVGVAGGVLHYQTKPNTKAGYGATPQCPSFDNDPQEFIDKYLAAKHRNSGDFMHSTVVTTPGGGGDGDGGDGGDDDGATGGRCAPTPPHPPTRVGGCGGVGPPTPQIARFATSHKMGTVMLKGFAKRYYNASARNRIPYVAKDPVVVLTREITDAVVSGYLYHKAGHECWLGPSESPSTFIGKSSAQNYITTKKGGHWLLRAKWWESVTRAPYDLQLQY